MKWMRLNISVSSLILLKLLLYVRKKAKSRGKKPPKFHLIKAGLNNLYYSSTTFNIYSRGSTGSRQL